MALAFVIFSDDNLRGPIFMLLAVALTLFVLLRDAFAKAVAAGLDQRVGQVALAPHEDANPNSRIAVNSKPRFKLSRQEASKIKHFTE